MDAKGKKEIEDKIAALLEKEREFAENSPMPPPESRREGVYCTGPECHDLQPKWERKEELLPPKSSVEPVWIVEGFGRGRVLRGGNAPIHFGEGRPPHRRRKSRVWRERCGKKGNKACDETGC